METETKTPKKKSVVLRVMKWMALFAVILYFPIWGTALVKAVAPQYYASFSVKHLSASKAVPSSWHRNDVRDYNFIAAIEEQKTAGVCLFPEDFAKATLATSSSVVVETKQATSVLVKGKETCLRAGEYAKRLAKNGISLNAKDVAGIVKKTSKKICVTEDQKSEVTETFTRLISLYENKYAAAPSSAAEIANFNAKLEFLKSLPVVSDENRNECTVIPFENTEPKREAEHRATIG